MFRKQLFFTCFSLIVAVTVMNCGPQTAKSAYDSAYNLYSKGNFEKSIESAQLFLSQYPDSEFQPDIYLVLANSYKSMNRCQDAITYYEKIVGDHPAFPKMMEAKFNLGLCHYTLGNFKTAIEVFESILPKGTLFEGDQQYINKANYYLAESYRENGQYRQAADKYTQIALKIENEKDKFDTYVTIADLHRLAGDLKSAVQFYLKASYMTKFSTDLGPVYYKLAETYAQLRAYPEAIVNYRRVIDNEKYGPLGEEAYQSYLKWLNSIDEEAIFHQLILTQPGGRVGYQAHLHYVYLLEDFEFFDRALEELERIQNYYHTSGLYDPEFLKELKERIYLKKQVKLNYIGCLAPLTGKYALYGNRIHRGAKLAIDQYNRDHPEDSKVLLIKDTKGTPEKAAEETDILVRKDQVVAILGPVLPGCVEQVAPLTDKYQIAAITPSAGTEGIPDLSKFLFRNSLTNEAQAEAIADFAIDVNGLTRFAIIYPDAEFGIELRKLFAKHVTQRGGQIVFEMSYPPDTDDFKEVILELKKHDFEGLYIPDHARMVAVMVPQMRFYEMPEVALLGCNSWHSSDLLQIGEKFTESSVFVDGFFADSPNPMTREFVEAYRALYDEKPDLLAAQAYDSVRMFLYCLDSGANSRFDVRDCLVERIKDFQGVTGLTTFAPNGEVMKELFLLGAYKGKFIQLN